MDNALLHTALARAARDEQLRRADRHRLAAQLRARRSPRRRRRRSPSGRRRTRLLAGDVTS